ncbi:MAG: imidazole glycerol phosphate synthase subunit HisF [Acidobacteria bacterium]|nr:imidazole glycerol phosphate synthase subunit HisF [Acidobacteriota bacterium]
MFRPRIIPVLLLKDQGLVKSIRFGNHKYIGDPLNAVRIFNEFRADELIFLDIAASENARPISVEFVRKVGEEARMPFAAGGGITSVSHIEEIIKAGAEKVIINSRAAEDPDFVKEAADKFGSTTIVVCIDVRTDPSDSSPGWVMKRAGDPVEFARLMEENGAGEIIIQSMDRDGTMSGYDIELIKAVSSSVSVPVVALGGAGKNQDLVDAYRDGYASGLAAGSLFVYQSTNRGVLINYPDRNEIVFN